MELFLSRRRSYYPKHASIIQKLVRITHLKYINIDIVINAQEVFIYAMICFNKKRLRVFFFKIDWKDWRIYYSTTEFFSFKNKIPAVFNEIKLKLILPVIGGKPFNGPKFNFFWFKFLYFVIMLDIDLRKLKSKTYFASAKQVEIWDDNGRPAAWSKEP